MKPTAIILLGFQNDFFSDQGILNAAVKEGIATNKVLENTINLLNRLIPTDALIVTTPICFSADYSELQKPTGMMATIRDLGAFRSNSFGGSKIPEIEAFGDRIIEVQGKNGFNAFHNTQLLQILEENKVEDVVILGVVTSVCIDSTGRSASEKGFNVTVLRDCTAGRSPMEHDFYCDEIIPLYGQVKTSVELTRSLISSENTQTALTS